MQCSPALQHLPKSFEIKFLNELPPFASFPHQTLHNSSQLTVAVDFNQAICVCVCLCLWWGGCENLNGVHIFPLSLAAIFRDTNKKTVTGAIYKVINISDAVLISNTRYIKVMFVVASCLSLHIQILLCFYFCAISISSILTPPHMDFWLPG